MHKKILQVVLCLAMAITPLFFYSIPVQAANQTVKVGVYDNPPKVYTDKNGKAQGFFPDVMNAIGQQENWDIQWVKGTWEECLAKLQKGQIDIMVDVAETPDRKAIYDFNDETVLLAWGQVFARKNLNIESMTDLDGKTMAVLESGVLYNGAGGIRPTAESFDLKIKYVNVNDYADVFKMLNDGTADVGVVNNIYGLDQADKYDIKATNIIFQPSELHFALTKDNPRNSHLIKRIDSDLRAMKADQNSAYYQSLKTNLKGSVKEVSVIPLWATILLWSVPGIAALALVIFLVQKRYQKSLKKAITIKTKELLESELTYRNLFESSKDAIMLSDINGFIDCNQATLDLFKISTVEEFTRKHPGDLSPPKQPNGENSTEAANNKIKKALQEGTQHFEWVHTKSDGTEFDADVLLAKVIINGKEILQSTVRDISEQKRAEKSIKELNELKDIFIRVVSHQLRTPMSAIRWNLEILLKEEMGELTGAQEKFIRSTYDAEVEVINRVSDLLTVIDIEEGRIAINKEKTVLNGLCESVVSIWKKDFQAKDIQFKYAEPLSPLPSVDIDSNKIRSIFNYMFRNALDYTPAKGTVTAALLRKDKSIRFEITDTGIGIPKEEQAKIFLKFYRASNAATTVTDRTGISLAISKYYIELHGGHIGFESQEDHGSTFWFELPIKK